MTSAELSHRETFSSVWGSLLALLGVSIGLGNFWRFPYMMGIFGGAAFLAVYLLVVLLVGVPALLAELALGRATRRGPVGALAAAGLPAGKAIGFLLFFAVAMAMTYYLVVLGWILAFTVLSVGRLVGITDPDATTFAALHANWPAQMACSAVVAALASIVVSRGVREGIERISRLCLPLFAALTIGLALWALALPGAGAGVAYLFEVDWQAMTPRALLAALGQAFFSLGLGGTFLVIYGSYLPDDADLPRRALTTAGGDIAASLLGVLVIMPVAFAYGLSPASGPPLLFEVMPAAFREMPAGAVFSVLFFVGLGSVAFLSGVAAIEVLVGSMEDSLGWRRRASVKWVTGALVVLGLPATMSIDYIVLSDLVWGSTMQPAGSVAAVGALAWALGRARARDQLGRDNELPRWVDLWFVWIRYVVPAAVLAALVSGWLV